MIIGSRFSSVKWASISTYGTYNALGQPVSIAYGNGVTTYFTYEANTFRTKSLQTSKGGTTFQNLEYVYDPADNVATITDYLTSANTQTFGYDGLNRLTSAAATSYGTLSYTYNEIGNMLSNSQVGAYTYPASGSSSVRPHAVTTAGSSSYTYDANGNMLSGAGRTFNSYNVENRPTSLTVGSTTTFVYDGDGARVKKTTGTSIAWYISKLYECDATTCQKYIWGGSQRIAVKQVSNSQIHFYHGDHLGSTNVVTDGNGVEVQRVNYTPFGEVRDNPIPTIAYKYTGKERDSATGLYWYEWRSYDPLLARFTSPDTIVPRSTDPQALNRYTYVRNNPLLYIDPTGHDFGISALIISMAVTAAANAGINAAIAAITGGNVGQAAKYGAISGAVSGGLNAMGVPFMFSSAAGGAAAAAATGRNPAIGAHMGAWSSGMLHLGDTGAMADGSQPATWQESVRHQVMVDAFRGAILGAAVTATLGGKVFKGALAGALAIAGGHQFNNLIGHAVGYWGSGGKSPQYVPENGGTWYYPGNSQGAITFGNVIWGPNGFLTSHGLSGLWEHESKHVNPQGTVAGPTYVFLHGAGYLVGGIAALAVAVHNGTFDNYIENAHDLSPMESYGMSSGVSATDMRMTGPFFKEVGPAEPQMWGF